MVIVIVVILIIVKVKIIMMMMMMMNTVKGKLSRHQVHAKQVSSLQTGLRRASQLSRINFNKSQS